MDQIILEVSDGGRFLKYISKEEGHQGKGKKHLAITVILENSKGQILLQKRKHRIFDNIWDITGATHPLHKSDGTDENLEQATRRCLKKEWGIDHMGEIRKLGVFNYFAPYGDFCENEHCAVMFGEYDGQLNLNKEIGYEYKWVAKEDFLKDITKNPSKYTKWAQGTVRILSEACGLSA